jgi:hypothetical protein
LKRGDIEIINYLSDSAGSRNLVIDVSITHDRHGSSSAHPHLNGTLSHPDTPDAPLNEAAKRKVNKYRNSTLTITSSLARLEGITRKMDEMNQLLQPIQNKNDTVSTPHNTSSSVVENDIDDNMTEEADKVIATNNEQQALSDVSTPAACPSQKTPRPKREGKKKLQNTS